MDITPYVENLRSELATAAAAGGDEARALAERLTAPLDMAARVVLLDALSAAAAEITRELAPGSVDLRLRGREPSFVVTLPDANDDAAMAPPPAASGATPDLDEATTARINFRLGEGLKARVEAAAGSAGLSVNAWLIRATTGALDGGTGTGTGGGTQASASSQTRWSAGLGIRSSGGGGQRYTGWAR